MRNVLKLWLKAGGAVERRIIGHGMECQGLRVCSVGAQRSNKAETALEREKCIRER